MKTLENKVPPLLVMMLLGIVMWLVSPLLPTLSHTSAPFAVASAIAAAGLYFIAAGVIEFRRHQTTVDPRQPKKASSLVVSGIYKRSRNPMYVGFALLLVALVAALQSPLLLAGVAAFVIYMNKYQITPEERAMASHFGEHYVQYMKQVRRWL